MTRIRTHLMAALAVAGAGLAAAGSADAALSASHPSNYTFPSGFQGFYLLSHGGPVNPGVLVGFNPQPDPPGFGTTDFSSLGNNTLIGLLNPSDPVLTNPADGGTFDVLIALLGLGDGLLIPAVMPPNTDGFTGFRTVIGGHDISVDLQFGGSPVSSWSWGAFNPQPDPPGRWGGAEIGFAGDPFMGLQLTIDGTQETFTLAGAPEPATWGLMLVGFFGAGLGLRAQRRGRALAA